MTTFLRYASLLLLGFAALAIIMTMVIVEAEAKDSESNTNTPPGAKSLIAPKSDRSSVAEATGNNSTGGDSAATPRQIVVEEAPKPTPSVEKIEVAKGEEVTSPAPKSLAEPKLPSSAVAEDATPETESAPAVPAPKAEAPAAPAPTLTSDSYHSAYRHSFYGHAYGYGYSDDDYDGCE